jgi:signal transduction histidine kinase
MISAVLILMLELTALSVFVMMLHCLRRVIGIVPLYLMLGNLFMLGQATWIPELVLDITPNIWDTLSYGLLLIPVMSMFLVIYETEGTVEAQRFILGMLVLGIGFFFTTRLLFSHYSVDSSFQWYGDSESFLLVLILQQGMLGLIFLHLLLFFLLPILYQAMRNRRVPVLICLFVSMNLYLITAELLLSYFSQKEVTGLSWNVAGGRCLLVTWISLLSYLYMHLGRALRMERRSGAFGIVIDLFKHLQNTSQMRQSLAEWAGRYQAVFDNSSELIFLLDQHGMILNANTAAMSALHRLLMQADFTLASRVLHADDRPFVWEDEWQRLWRGSEEKRVITFTNMILLLPEERRCDVDFNLSQAWVNEKAMAVLIMHDMTEQRDKEREHQKLEEQLIHSQRLEAVGQLAGGVAHDFNNLLHGILGSIEMLSRQDLSPVSRAMLGNIDAASKKAAALTSQLLGFARKGKFQEELLDLGALIAQAGTLFNTTAKEINFKTLLDPEPMMICGDATQLQQIILNLLFNSKDAVAELEGEKRIVLRAEPAFADMPEWDKRPKRDAKAADYVCVKVRDNGCGISPESLGHIFDPFFTTKGPQKGTGMGLAMVYGCVTHHQGWLDVKSEVGTGTEFCVFLPKARQVKINGEH